MSNGFRRYGQAQVIEVYSKPSDLVRLAHQWTEYTRRSSVFCHDGACPFVPGEKFEYDPTNFLYYRARAITADVMNCVPPGTKITMADWSDKNVEDIAIGDTVISHTGKRRKVTKLFKFDQHKQLVGIRPTGWCDSLWITPDQKVWAIPRQEYRRTRFNEVYYRNYPDHRNRDQGSNVAIADARVTFLQALTPKWIPASDLKRGDRVVFRFDTGVTECNELAGSDMARLMGYYLAEGCRGAKTVIFVTHKDESEFIQDLQDIAIRLGSGVRTVYHPSIKSARTSFNSNGGKWIDLCEKHCGKYAGEQHLSKEIMHMPLAWQKEFFLAYLQGDGSQHKPKSAGLNRYSGTIRGVTASKRLAQDLQQLCWRLGVHASVSGRPNPGNFAGAGMIYELAIGSSQAAKLFGDTYAFRFRDYRPHGKIFNRVDINAEGYVYAPVAHVEQKSYEGPVYDFEVEEDLSYIANRLVVFDCNGDRFPHAEIIPSYSTFAAKGIYFNHDSLIPEKAFGIILDAVYTPILFNDDKYADKYVEILGAIDRKSIREKRPGLLEDIESGRVTSTSMGTLAARAKCSLCGNIATDFGNLCAHMHPQSPTYCKGRHVNGSIVYEDNYGLNFLEDSIVYVPADPTAHMLEVYASRKSSPELGRLAELFARYSIAAGRKLKETPIELVSNFTQTGGLIMNKTAADKTEPKPEVSAYQEVAGDVTENVADSAEKMVDNKVDRIAIEELRKVLGPVLEQLDKVLRPEIKTRAEQELAKIKSEMGKVVPEIAKSPSGPVGVSKTDKPVVPAAEAPAVPAPEKKAAIRTQALTDKENYDIMVKLKLEEERAGMAADEQPKEITAARVIPIEYTEDFSSWTDDARQRLVQAVIDRKSWNFAGELEIPAEEK